jgi:hypothetical protein
MEIDLYKLQKDGAYIPMYPMTYSLEQREQASAKATKMGKGLYMAVGNSSTHYYAVDEVPVGKVLVSMPEEYKGQIITVCMMDSASDPLDLEAVLAAAKLGA